MESSSSKGSRKKYTSFKGLARQLSIRSLKTSASSNAVNSSADNELKNDEPISILASDLNLKTNYGKSPVTFQRHTFADKKELDDRRAFHRSMSRSASMKQQLVMLQRQDSQETPTPATPPSMFEEDQYANQNQIYSDVGYYTDKRQSKASLSSLPPDLPPPRSGSQTFSPFVTSPVSPAPQKSILVSGGGASTRSQRKGILQRSPSAITSSKHPEFAIEYPQSATQIKQNNFFPVNPSVSPHSTQRMSWSRDSPRRLPSLDSQELSSRFLTVDQARNNSLVHQRSSESHDSTTSYVSMASAASMGYVSGSENETGSNQNPPRFETCDSCSTVAPAEPTQPQMWRSALTNLKQKRGSFFKKKSKPIKEPEEVDPIYQLLKCASNFNGQTCGVCDRPKVIPVGPKCTPDCSEQRHWCDTCKCPCHTTIPDPSKGLGTTARDLVGTQARQALDRSRTLSPPTLKTSKR